MRNTNKHPNYSSVIGKRKQALRLTITLAFIFTCLFGFAGAANALDIDVSILAGGSGGTGTVDVARGTSVAGDEGSVTNGTSPQTFSNYLNGETAILTATPDAGMYFNGWGGTQLSGTTNPETLTQSGNETVTAVFERNFVNFTTLNQTISEGFNIQFTVQSDVNVASDVVVGWTITNGSTVDADFPGSVTSGTATITGGSNSRTFNVGTFEDTVFELDETFTITISINSGPAFLGAADTANGTIFNDDTYDVSIGATAYNPTETDSDFTLNIPVNLDQTVPGGASVSYTITPASAVATSDYVDLSGGTLTYTAAETTKDIQITIKGDNIVEADETFSVSISAGANQTVSNTPSTVTITDDDTATLTVTAAPNQAENVATYDFTVTLDNAVEGGFDVAYTTNDGTAVAASDYTDNDSNLSFTGSASEFKTVNVAINNDTLVEADETFTFSIGAVTPVEASPGDIGTSGSPATGTVTDNDAALVSIAANDAAASEPAGGNDGQFTVSVDNQSQSPTVVSYTVTGDATAGSDYTALSGSVTIPANTSNATIDVTVLNDTLLEDDETVQVTLNSVTSGDPSVTIDGANKSATVTISDDDTATASIAANDAAAAEPAGSNDGQFTVSLDNQSDTATVLSYSVAGDATAGGDYTALSGSVTIPANTSSATINVAVLNDVVLEDDETVQVTLTGVTSGDADISVDGTPATVTISDDDAATASIAANDAAAAEPAGSNDGQFTVSLDNQSDSATVVAYSVGGDATGGSDYTAISGSVTIPANTSNATINVAVITDALVEDDETVTVTLTSVTSGDANIAVDGTPASVTISDDDSATVSLAATTPAAAEPGTDGQFTVSLNNQSDSATVVAYSVAGDATGGSDYTALSGSVTIPANTSNATIDVAVIDETLLEDDETVQVTLTSVTSGDADITVDGTPATVTISDDDTALVSIAANDALASEPAGANDGQFTVSLDNQSDIATVVSYSVAGDATAGGDYTALSGSVTIPANTSNATIDVAVLNDVLLEDDETVQVTLTGITSGDPGIALDVGNSVATVTISDDDTATASIAANDAAAAEPAGSNDGQFTVSLDNQSDSATVVAYSVGGDATAGSDYTALSGSVTIPANTSNATINVAVITDALVEDDETVTVTLTSVTSGDANIAVDGTPAAVTISDDDSATASLAANDATATEPADNGQFTVSLDNQSDTATVISYSVAGDATGGSDYTALSGSVTVPANTSSATIDVAVIDETLLEDDETVQVTLTGVTSGDADISVDGTPAIVTISDDDTATASIAATTPAATEPATDGQFTVSLDNQSDTATQIAYTVTGTASSGIDYTALTNSVTVPANTSSVTIDVAVIDDNIVENSETVEVTLTSPITSGDANIAVDTTPATVTIADDDATTVSVSATIPAATEPGTNGSFAIQLAGGKVAPAGGLTVSYALDAGNTATPGSDYTALTGSATIAAAASAVAVPVVVIDNAIVEGDESVTINLTGTNYVGATIAASPNDSATVIISDDDLATLTISDATPVDEDHIGTRNHTFTVTLSGDVDQSFTVDFATADGSASTGDTDYSGDANTLTFTGINTEFRQVTILANGDFKVEADETFAVNLSNNQVNGKNVTFADNQGIATILNDDFARLELTGPAAAADEDSGNRVYTLTLLDRDVQDGLTIDYATTDGSATIGDGDYTDTNGTVTFTGTTNEAHDITVPIGTDTKVEADETFRLTINNLTYSAEPGAISQIGLSSPIDLEITNDDTTTLTLSGPASQAEAVATYTFSVQTSNAVQGGFSVAYDTDAGTASFGSDLTDNDGTLNFAGTAGEIETIDVAIIDNAIVEASESFTVTLGTIAPVETDLADFSTAGTPATGTIADDEAATFTVDNQTLSEDGGNMTFTVSLDTQIDIPVTVDVTYTDGTATGGGADYDSVADSVAFAAGDTADKTVTVSITDDAVQEPDENFTVNLSTATAIADRNADFTDTGTGTITNEDYTINFGPDVTVDESDGVATFTVSLDRINASGAPITMLYNTGDVGDTATGGSDYGAAVNVPLSIANGEISETFNITINEDGNIEFDEVFTVTLSSPSSKATIADDTAVGTINNNDTYDITINDAAAAEGSTVQFTVTLDTAVVTADSVTVDYATVNQTADGSDFTAAAGTLTFNPGETTQTIDVVTTDDTTVERTETFEVVISNPTSATRGTPTLSDDTGVGTITNDDNYEISMQDVTGTEGNTLNFDFGLSQPVLTGDSLTFTVQTADGSATIANADYTQVNVIGTTLNGPFASLSWGVNTTADATVERDETFSFTISAVSTGFADTNVVVLDDTGVGTIQNNDNYSVTVDDITESEGDDIVFTVTVNQTPVAGDSVTVNYTTSDNTTSGASDYTLATTSVTFNPSETTKTVTVATVEDDLVENDESFNLNINSTNTTFGDTGSGIGDNLGIGTITNDDKYKFSIDDVQVEEQDGVGATIPATFTISSHQTILAGQTATVGYATGSTATEAGHTESPIAIGGTDYVEVSPTFNIVFSAGETTKTVDITVLNEGLDVDTEYYYVNVEAVSANTQVDDATGVGTIIDNEYAVNASVDVSNNQGDICQGATCADPDDVPPDAMSITEIVERSSDSSAFTVTADAGFCIGDVTRDGASVLGGVQPISPYVYTATNIQNDPTTIVASFRSEINFTTNIEPSDARTYGRWRMRDTTNNVYVVPAGHPDYPSTAVGADAWLQHGETIVIPCDQAGYDLEFMEVSGWFTPATVNYSIPPGGGTTYTATGTYVSKTVKLTLAESGGTGSETIDVDPTGTAEGGPNTHTYLLVDNETVTVTANSSIVVGSETIFLRWIGPVADEFASSTTLLMDGDKTVTAVFGLPGVDNDGDGYLAGTDCDDTDPTVHPDATELCGDGIDQDCSGGDPVCVGPDADDDGDGYTENQGDCNDSNAAIHPGATEICGNTVDEDCYDGPRDCGTEVICSDYAERPLETQAQSAAPMVMFVLDDSGSMDWTMMTEESDGLFDGERYVWSVGDNQYSQVLSSSERKEWESQYSAYNKMYYNPATDYVPWPQWNTADDTEGTTGTKIKDGGTAPPIDADPDDPRSNPVRDDWTLDMDATFFTVLPASTITQWISVERHGGSTGNSTLADVVKLVGTGYAGDPDTFASDAAVLANNNLIVDNEPDQADHTFVENGDWNTSGSPNPWDENARWTDDNTSAVWQFSIPIAGTYDVYARWNEYNQRDENARYTVVHNNGASTPTYDVNQRLNGNSWVLLATGLNFTVQDNTSGGAIDVKNAHYFTWYDADTDDTIDAGEVYLVNVPGSGGTYTMEFYQFNDDGDDVVEDGELLQVTSGTAFDAIQPRTEGGTLRTAAEERQNIANWWSFYRRRELTAKAAIGRTISGTEGMHIGILGINGRIEEELVPIGVESTLGKTLDNQDASFSDVGTWSESGSPNEFNGSSVFGDNSGDSARWTPTFTAGEAGTFRVYAWWNCFSNRDSNAKYTVVDKDGSTDYFKDQRSGQTNSQCGQWVELGIHAFDETGGQYVEVARHAGSTGSSTNADAVRFVSTGAAVTVNQTPYILNKLYQVNSDGGTPLRRGLQNAGEYFDNEDNGATGGLTATAPWASAADGGGCQRAFAILMTDGYYNGSDPSPSVGNEDSDGNRPSGTNANANAIGGSIYDSSFYAGTGSNTLGDVAMYYYEKDLHGGLADDVPPVNYDLADHQHMVTYGVSFGVTGTLDPTAYPDCLPDTPPSETTADCPTWPTPDSNARKIDDLYHASVNGRGKYLNAANPGELVAALKEIIEDVADKTGTGSSVSINAQELKEGTLLFQASYLTDSWRGDLQAKTLNAQTGEIESALWSAAEQLFSKTHDTRKIVTYNGSAGKHFRFDTTTYTSELTDDQIKKLLNLAEARDLTTTPLTTTEETDLEKLIDYLRGDATNEGTAGGTFRQRARKDGETDIGVLGDIVHSAPLHVGNVVYVGGNDGMLHAFDDATGEELWAYVPNLIYDDLDELAGQSYQHNFYVDNSPFSQVIYDSGGNPTTLLTGTLGRGGKGVYALDISSPTPSTEADAKALVKWEYPTTPGSDDDLGYGYGRAFTVNSHLDDGGNATRYVTIMGNGYQSADGKAVLYVLDAHNGTLLGKIDTGVGSPTLCNGLSVPVLIDPDFDGVADFAYAGDLLGNMWKFDLRGNSISDWKVAYNTKADGTSGSPMPMFQAKNKDGHRQPITTKADVMAHPDASLGGYMVIFGTGRYLGNADFGENSTQTVYGIWDWQKTWEVAGSTSPDKYYGDFGPVATGDPLFGRLSYTNKPVDDDFAVGETVTGFTSGATGVIEEIEETSDTTGSLKLINLSTAQFQNGEFITSTSVTADARADGTLQTVTFRPLNNLATHTGLAGVGQYATLLEQNQIAFIQESRFMSDNQIDWFVPGQTSSGALEHVGWYFDLPGNNEKMIRDPLIRNGIAFVISSIPSSSPCASGGSSIIHALDAATGGRSLTAVFDISGPDGVPDGKIDEHDLVNIGTPDNPRYVAPTGLKRDAMWYTPAVLAVQESETDVMYFSTSEGDVQLMKVEAEKVGVFYWREIE